MAGKWFDSMLVTVFVLIVVLLCGVHVPSVLR